MEKPDFGSTTAVIAYVRRRITPAMLWSAIGGLTLALFGAITWIVTTQADIHRLQESVTDLQGERAQDRPLLQQLVNGQTAMNSKVDYLTQEMNRQRDWRERIEQVAEESSRPRRRK